MGLACVAAWPGVLQGSSRGGGPVERSLRLGWVGACVLLASFTYMPVVGKEAYYPLVYVLCRPCGNVIDFISRGFENIQTTGTAW